MSNVTDLFDEARAAMIASQLRPNAVDDSRLLAVLAEVPRERFVPAERQPVAYAEVAHPLGDGRTMNAPMVTARLLDAAAVLPGDRVLVVAPGTGYAVAVLAAMGARVIAVEDDAMLAAATRTAVPDAAVIEGPLAEGAPADAPFDAIVIEGAVEQLPDALIAQLAPEGRLVCGLLDAGTTRLAVGRRGGSGFGLTSFGDADMAVLAAFSRPRGFVF